MSWIVEHWDELATAAASIITIASVIVRLTPTTKDDLVLAEILGFLSFLQHKNVGGAKLPLTPAKKA